MIVRKRYKIANKYNRIISRRIKLKERKKESLQAATNSVYDSHGRDAAIAFLQYLRNCLGG